MRWRTALLSMALGLTVAGIVHGEEDTTGNWFTHMFSPASNPAPPPPLPAKSEPRTIDNPPVLSTRARRREAEKAYMRRLEAIQKLYALAEQLDDAKLHKDAELLDQRNYDVFRAAYGSVRVSDPESFSAQNTSTKEKR